MSNIDEYCMILGIGNITNTTSDILKKAYRKKAKQYHTDVTGSDKEIQKINEAYENLSKILKEVEFLNKIAVKDGFTAIITLEELIGLSNGKSKEIEYSDKKYNLTYKNINSNRVYISIELSINASNYNNNFSFIQKANRGDIYRCECTIYSDNLNNKEAIKLKCLDKEKEINTSSNSIEIPIVFDNGIKIIIDITRKILNAKQN